MVLNGHLSSRDFAPSWAPVIPMEARITVAGWNCPGRSGLPLADAQPRNYASPACSTRLATHLPSTL